MRTELHQGSQQEIRDLLVGRSVVAVSTQAPDDFRPYDAPEGTIVLDDGTVLEIFPNEGCGGCSSGWYTLEELNKCENIITDVQLSEEDEIGEWKTGTRYSIFVFAENRKINLAVIEGDDGNGFYGSGYRIKVRVPDATD